MAGRFLSDAQQAMSVTGFHFSKTLNPYKEKR